jgi:hypothetical protein
MQNKTYVFLILVTFIFVATSCKDFISCNKFRKPHETYIINLNQKFYSSIPNPIKIIIPNVIYDSISIITHGAQIQSHNKENDYYIVVPDNESIMHFYFELFRNKKLIFKDSIQCNVTSLPDPILYLPIVNNFLNTNSLLQMSKLNSEIINLSINIPCNVKSFQLVVLTENRVFTLASENEFITNEQRETIHLLKDGDIIIFKNVIVEMPDKTIRVLKPVFCEISN